ncbi:MAG: S-layer homology domain-containing protein [Oscillospiraceae bacterium]|nr:S-layer homology domain-containing protein [Oscillospiraceae bacterium]
MKRILSVFLSLNITICLFLSSAFAAKADAGFSDVSPDDWFAPYVAVCAQQGLLNGVGEGRFAPGQVLNSDEALVMAARVLLKANGETEFPKGPDAQGFWDWAGWYKGLRFCFGSSVNETENYVNAWYWDALFYLAQAAGPELFSEGITYASSRYTFFKALGFAARGLELEEINQVEQVPGTRDEDILRLYRAGILSGVDGLGTFAPRRELTRAEAAAALARIARPELRVKFDPEPFPYEGYTLTPLMEIDAMMYPDYPVAPILYYQEDSQQLGGLLTLDGRLVDYPEGRIFSSGVGRSYDYIQFYVVDGQWNARTWLMDRDGNYAPGSGEYEELWATGDGHFLACDHWSDGELGHTSWYLLSPDGSVVELPETLGASPNSWSGLSWGLCPWMDEETGLWGYVNTQEEWVMEPAWASAQLFEGWYAILGNDQGQWAVIDRGGNLVVPFQDQYLELPRSSPGYGQVGLIRWEDWAADTEGYLGLDGTVYSLGGSLSRFYNGFATAWDDSSEYYLDAQLCRRTEGFDWCSDVTPEGQGFVGMDGKIYRIQFDR